MLLLYAKRWPTLLAPFVATTFESMLIAVTLTNPLHVPSAATCRNYYTLQLELQTECGWCRVSQPFGSGKVKYTHHVNTRKAFEALRYFDL